MSTILDDALLNLKTPEVKASSLKWMKEYQQQEKEKQDKIDNNPESQTLYTFEIDINTLKIEKSETKVLDYDEDVTGYAEYEESSQGRHVYAESLVSADKARMLVMEYLLNFYKAYFAIATDKNI